jgi:hypothetical protein
VCAKSGSEMIRKGLLISVTIAAFLTLLALWLTSGEFDPNGGKSALVGALIVLPLVVAAKNGLTGLAATSLAFTAYFAVAFLSFWLATRKK